MTTTRHAEPAEVIDGVQQIPTGERAHRDGRLTGEHNWLETGCLPAPNQATIRTPGLCGAPVQHRPREVPMSMDIVVQNVASFRIDPAQLRRDGRRLALITSPANHERLIKRGQRAAVDELRVVADFSPAALADVVEDLRAPLASTAHGRIRLLCHDEYSLASVAEVRAMLDITGATPEQMSPFVDKLVMKEAVGATGVRLPKHRRWNQGAYLSEPFKYASRLGTELGWPLFVKPLDESGSVGTARLDTPEQLHVWARRHGGTRKFEVDEYLDGILYHVDSVVIDGRIVFAQANEYLFPCYDYLSGRVCSTYTLAESDPMWAPLLEFNATVLNGLGDRKPANTVTHHEIFCLADGELVFLEIAARAPAALVPYVYEKHRGFNIELAHFQVQMEESPRFGPVRGPYAGFVYFPRRHGQVTALNAPELDSEHEVTWLVAPGELMTEPEDIREAAATVLLWNDDPARLRADLDRLTTHRAFDVA